MNQSESSTPESTPPSTPEPVAMIAKNPQVVVTGMIDRWVNEGVSLLIGNQMHAQSKFTPGEYSGADLVSRYIDQYQYLVSFARSHIDQVLSDRQAGAPSLTDEQRARAEQLKSSLS